MIISCPEYFVRFDFDLFLNFRESEFVNFRALGNFGQFPIFPGNGIFRETGVLDFLENEISEIFRNTKTPAYFPGIKIPEFSGERNFRNIREKKPDIFRKPACRKFNGKRNARNFSENRMFGIFHETDFQAFSENGLSQFSGKLNFLQTDFFVE